MFCIFLGTLDVEDFFVQIMFDCSKICTRPVKLIFVCMGRTLVTSWVVSVIAAIEKRETLNFNVQFERMILTMKTKLREANAYVLYGF